MVGGIMQGSKYAPIRQSEYSSKDLNLNFIGNQFTIPKGTTYNCDYKILDDLLVDGGRIIATNVVAGDSVTCQVIDKDNILGYGAGFVLNQFVTTWYLVPGQNLQWDFTVNYPAKVYAGLWIRVIYNSVGTETDPWVAINYKLHKVLW